MCIEQCATATWIGSEGPGINQIDRGALVNDLFPTCLRLEEVVCCLCGNKRSVPFLAAPDRTHHVPGIFTLHRCEFCGLIYLNPRPSSDSFAIIYPEDYGPYQELPNQTTLHTDWRRLCAFIKRIQPHPGQLLDVGSGSGAFLRAMRLLLPHWSVTGIEPDARAVRLARRSGARVIHATLETAPLDGTVWDAITLWNVLEHLPDPLAALRRLRQLLKPGGVIYLTIPLCDSWDARLYGSYWCGWELPRHFYAFDRLSLGRLLNAAGLIAYRSACLVGIEYHVTESLRIMINANIRRFAVRRLSTALTFSRPFRLLIRPYLWTAAWMKRCTALTIAARAA
jgi:SAM-dependent methyltransferase